MSVKANEALRRYIPQDVPFLKMDAFYDSALEFLPSMVSNRFRNDCQPSSRNCHD
jgi:hypothetical protein